jgi:hypothetical protein
VQSLPDARCLPVPQSSPAGHAAAAAQFLWEQPPRAARPQHEDDASKGGAIRNPWATAFRFRRFLRQQGFDGLPEVVGDKH